MDRQQLSCRATRIEAVALKRVTMSFRLRLTAMAHRCARIDSLRHGFAMLHAHREVSGRCPSPPIWTTTGCGG